MNDENINKEIVETTGAPVAEVASATSKDSRPTDQRDFKRNTRKPSQNRREFKERVKPEFDQKIIDIRRVTRVVTGGRRFSFSVAVVAGDRAGRVGVGQGKATDTPLAIDKAFRDAKKNMIKIPLTKNHSIPHEVSAKYASSQVMIMPAPGKGVLAGSSVRTVLEFLGAKEVGAKLLSRSKNKVNNAKATLKALSKMKIIKVKAETK
jgi:small subunit ribosomal protein S5